MAEIEAFIAEVETAVAAIEKRKAETERQKREEEATRALRAAEGHERIEALNHRREALGWEPLGAGRVGERRPQRDVEHQPAPVAQRHAVPAARLADDAAGGRRGARREHVAGARRADRSERGG